MMPVVELVCCTLARHSLRTSPHSLHTPHSATPFHLAELWRGHIHGGESRTHQPHVHHTENVPLKAYVLGCLLLVPKELALPPAVPVKRCRHRPSICSWMRCYFLLPSPSCTAGSTSTASCNSVHTASVLLRFYVITSEHMYMYHNQASLSASPRMCALQQSAIPTPIIVTTFPQYSPKSSSHRLYK